MASIISKRVGGHTYYYLREMARVGGKPKMVSERYLGKAADIEAAVQGQTTLPSRTQHLSFGDLAAVWGLLERLGVAEIADEVVGERRSDAAASVGTYVCLAAANRVVAPCSKLAFDSWWQQTCGDRLVHLPTGALDHRRFWDAMDAISPAQLTEIERRITERVVSEFSLDCEALVLDMTNFATYIDSTNPRAPIAQRGHAKQKRNDLRLVGLGLVITTDGNVPLLSHAYAGNRPDVTQFADVVGELAGRFRTVATATDGLTLVYDAGQDSAANQLVIERTGLHFVGSLRPSDHLDLLRADRRRFKVVDEKRFPGLTAYEARTVALGAERRVVVTHSDELHRSQVRGFGQTMAKAHRQLAELAQRLAGQRTRRTRAEVEAEIAKICSPRYVSRCVSFTLVGDTAPDLRLTFAIDEAARRRLESDFFGKRVLFTDHEDWPVEDVVAAYRSQWRVEADFRQMKDRDVVSFNPMFHWTDQKIRVHVFYCVLALTLARLLCRQAANDSLEMSVRELLGTLAGIEETVLLYQGDRGRPKARRMITDMDPIQQRLYDLFGLAAFAPRD
jgi:transposase